MVQVETTWLKEKFLLGQEKIKSRIFDGGGNEGNIIKTRREANLVWKKEDFDVVEKRHTQNKQYEKKLDCRKNIEKQRIT